MPKINFQIVTPERQVLSQEIDSLTCPTTNGQITVLPGHVPLIATLQSGDLIVRTNGGAGQTGTGQSGSEQHLAVSGGFIEVRPGNKVIILADSADRETEIDAQAAEDAVARAKESMQHKHTMSNEEYATVAAELEKNLARLKVIKRTHHSHGSQQNISGQDNVS